MDGDTNKKKTQTQGEKNHQQHNWTEWIHRKSCWWRCKRERRSERNINQTTKQWNDIWESSARVWLLSNWVETINKAYWLKTLVNVYAVLIFCMYVFGSPLILSNNVQIHFGCGYHLFRLHIEYNGNVCHSFHKLFFFFPCVFLHFALSKFT